MQSLHCEDCARKKCKVLRGVQHAKPYSHKRSRYVQAAQLNSTQLVELSRVGRSEHSDDPTQLNSTG